MIDSQMPSFAYSERSKMSQVSLFADGENLTQLTHVNKVAIVKDNTPFEIFCSCCYYAKYRIKEVKGENEVGDSTIYRMVQNSSCCPDQWTLYIGDEKKKAYQFTTTSNYATCFCCEGPGFKVTVPEGVDRDIPMGEVWRPYQEIINTGVDVKNVLGDKLYYFGTKYNCNEYCNKVFWPRCLLAMTCCCTCSDAAYTVPLYDHEKEKQVGKADSFFPCKARWFPCNNEAYSVVHFPEDVTENDKILIVAAWFRIITALKGIGAEKIEPQNKADA